MLDDVALRAGGSLAPPGSGGHTDKLIGRQGNAILVNGRVPPSIGARAGRRQRRRSPPLPETLGKIEVLDTNGLPTAHHLVNDAEVLGPGCCLP